jgi:broad specificity phosphatase PhoE
MRHGRSALPFPSAWISPPEFREWITAYNRTGIADDSFPPHHLRGMIDESMEIVCSDYPRSTESAASLAPNHRPNISTAFREAGRPLQASWSIRLPLKLWDWASCMLWKAGLISADEPVQEARRRAQEAARQLVSLAQASSQVLLVGHGTLNAMIGRELRCKGWSGPTHVSDEYWGVATFLKTS